MQQEDGCRVSDCEKWQNGSGYCEECEAVQIALWKGREETKEMIIEDGDLEV